MELSFVTWREEPYQIKGPLPPAHYLRKEFPVEAGLKRATLSMTALGVYTPLINGKRLSNRQLAPGYTEYPKRLQFQTCEVTAFLREGANVLAAVVGDGWYRGSCGPMGQRATYGTRLALAAELVLEYEDRKETIQTDESWKWTDQGPLRAQDLKLQEHYDARREIPGWDLPGFDDGGWEACAAASYPGTLVPDAGETLCEHEAFTPEVLHTPDGSTVLDFGQNMAGRVTFTVTGKAGQTVRLLHGEALDENGNFTTAHLGSDKILPLGQELVYDLRDGTQTYTPEFLICGFRYVRLLDWPETVHPEHFTARAIYSDVRMTGSFSCSNEKINRLVKNVEWSLKSNFVEIPTDCPQRERAGWTGDLNVFIECADLLADTRKFISKWLMDVTATQTEEGAILAIAPAVYSMGRGSRETSPGAAGWADVIVRAPLQQYLSYGETDDLEACYEAMKRFVDYNERRAKKSRFPWLLRGADPYILDTGFHYGEWLEPGASNLADAAKAMLAPDPEVATAWFFYSAKGLAEAAELLQKEEDASRYKELARRIRAAYRKRFLPEGQVRSKRPCRYVRPLYMGLADESEKHRIASALNDLVVANGYRVGTGFLSTYQILNVLSDNGYHETACRMMENEECPGWLYEVNCGATTIWEGWDAVDPKTGKVKAKSLNHYSPGAAVSWLWTRLCGIRPLAPGYAAVEIAPKPGGSLSFAAAVYDSIRGRIVSDWRIVDGRFTLRIEVPENVEAVVVLPDGSRIEHAKSGSFSCGV